MSRRHALGLLGAVALGSAVGCGSSLGRDGTDTSGPNETTAQRAIKVGLVYPLAGVYATIGEDMQRGWDLWLAQHGGLIGGLEPDIEFRDEGDTPDTGKTAVQGLLDANVDVIVGIVTTPTAVSSKPLVDAAKKLLILGNAGGGDLTGVDRSPYVWRTSFTNFQVSRPLGEYMAGQPELRDSVFAAAPDYAAGNEAIAGFKQGFEANGGGSVPQQLTPFQQTTNFLPLIANIEASGASAVYCFYAGAEAVGFVKQFASFGLHPDLPLYGSGFLTEGGVLETQGEAAIGIRTSLHYSTELDTDSNRDFLAAFRDAYDRDPTVFAVQMWDAALVLDRAVAAAESLSTDSLISALEGMGPIEDSPRGTWSFDRQSPKQSFYLREVVHGPNGALVNAVVEELGEYGQPDG